MYVTGTAYIGNITFAISGIDLDDNQATAFEFKEATNSYLKFVTTNGAEVIELGEKIDVTGDVTLSGALIAGSGVHTLTNATGLIDGEKVQDDTIDEDSLDFGLTAGQINSDDIPDHDGHSVLDTFHHLLNRGKAGDTTISLTGGLGISWTTGELYDKSSNTFISTDAGSGNLANHAINYLKWVSGTTLTISTTGTSGDEILVATFSVYDGVINGYRKTALTNTTMADSRRAMRESFPTRIISGLSVYEDADVTNALDVRMDAGVLYKEGMDRKTPIEIKTRTTAMVRHFHTAGVWDSDTNAQIEATNYDNPSKVGGQGLEAIGGNKWVKGLFMYMNGKIGFVYPTEFFNNEAQALDAALPAVPPGLSGIPKLTAVVYQQGDTDFTNATWQDVRAGIGETGFNMVVAHGSLTELDQDQHPIYVLNDGEATNITNGTFDLATTGTITAGNVSGTNTGDDSGTDDQKIDVFSISGDNVQLSLEDDGKQLKQWIFLPQQQLLRTQLKTQMFLQL